MNSNFNGISWVTSKKKVTVTGITAGGYLGYLLPVGKITDNLDNRPCFGGVSHD